MKLRLPEKLPIVAQPFPHAVLDDLLDAADFQALQSELDAHPKVHIDNEIFRHSRSAAPLQEWLQALLMTARHMSETFSLSLHSCGAAAQTYEPGDYLLPHSDYGEGRKLAYVYYLQPAERGGALLLYESGKPHRHIWPRTNRLVLFPVSHASLHQVIEVRQGVRKSIAGWFY